MRRYPDRRGFIKLSGVALAGAVLRPGLDDESRFLVEFRELGPLSPGAHLDLSYSWDPQVYLLTPDRGRFRIEASLFIEKGGKWNYDQDLKPGSSRYIVLPDPGETQLQWNSHEAIFNWGTRVLRPGDEIAFTENIDAFDPLTPDEYGDKGGHGDGYINFSNGICNASTTLGEAFGIEIEMDGVFVPLFIARPTSIQPHNYAHNPQYYDYAYNGYGVGVSPTNDRGHLPFMVNPNLPSSVVVALGLEARDTRPGKKRMGIYKPTVVVEVQGLPRDSRVRYERMTASREARERIVRRVIGARDYIMSEADSIYFDENGVPIRSDTPIPPLEPFDPPSVVEVGTRMESIFMSFLGSSRPPESMFPENLFPGRVARLGEHLADGSVIWKRSDSLLPLALEDLPAPMRRMSAEELFRILAWNNVGDARNKRYEKGGMVAMADWAQAYRFEDYPFSTPLPRWMTLRKQQITASIFYDWMVVDPAATILGWRSVINSEEAQALANRGYFVPSIVRSKRSVGLSPIALVAPGEGASDKQGNFWPNAVDGAWRFGPAKGKTVRDCFGYALNNGDYFPPQYFVWVPPELA